MNICLISTGYPPDDGGGIATYIYNLSLGLKELGHNVFVITQSRDRETEENIDDIKVYRFGSRYTPKLERLIPGLAWSRFLSKKVDEIDKRYGLDLIEFPNWEGGAYWYLRKRSRQAVVIRFHTPYFETLSLDKKTSSVTWTDKFICWLEEASCKKADTLVSSTVSHRSFIASAYGINPERINILPLGIKLAHNKNTDRQPENERIKVLYVSRLENRKGAMTLLDAIPKVLQKNNNIDFILVGQDRPHAPGNKLHADYFWEKYSNFQNRVSFLGFVSEEELVKHYENANLFVVPSVYESFGLIYVEAMMNALPVIGGKAGGIPEVVDDKKTGFLIEPGNVTELTEKILLLANDPELRNTMGENARKHCEEHFSYKIMAKKTEALYQETIKKSIR